MSRRILFAGKADRAAFPVRLPSVRANGAASEHRAGTCALRHENGGASVEMALATILMLTFLFGIMELGFALYTYHFVSEAAREATRYAMVRGSSCAANAAYATACPAASADVQNYARELGFPGIDPSAMTVTTTWPTTGATCTPSVTPCNNPGNLVVVTVNYQFPFSVPFIPAKTFSLTSTSEMVISD